MSCFQIVEHTVDPLGCQAKQESHSAFEVRIGRCNRVGQGLKVRSSLLKQPACVFDPLQH